MLDRIAQIFRGDERLAIAIELVVIWAVLFVALRFLRGTRGAGVLKGVIAILAAIILSLRFAGSGSESFARLRFIATFIVLGALLLFVRCRPCRSAGCCGGSSRA